MKDHDQTNPAVTAHQHSSNHRQSLEASERCGCFHCLTEFQPDKIREWTDRGQTAICPHCGIDSVLGTNDLEINQDLLKAMQDYWFNDQ